MKILPASMVMAWLAMTSTALASPYKILVTEASCAETKRTDRGAQPWDLGGKPDPYVVVAINGAPVYVSGVNANVTRARWFTGTEYWKLPTTAPVTITVRDADAGKLAAGIGMVGVAVRPDIPRIGKRMINDALAKVDTDDTIAVWSGTLDQLMKACGGVETDLLRSPIGQRFFKSNVGLTSLKVRVIDRATSPRKKRYFGLSGATVEKVKRSIQQPWDVGLGAAMQPDPRYVVYVNGSPVVAGGVNRDSYAAIWSGDPVALDVRDDDTIAVALFDADAGSQVSSVGKTAVLFSPSLTPAAKEKMYETMRTVSTDDLIFLWVGDWKSLAGAPALPRANADPQVWTNDGLVRADTLTRPAVKRATGAALNLVVVSASIHATKPNRKAWDAGKGDPDPLIRCFVAAAGGGWAAIGESTPVQDSLRPTWRLALADKRLTPGTRVKFEVYDKDRLSNDLIGTVVITVPNEPGTYSGRSGAITTLVYQVVRTSR